MRIEIDVELGSLADKWEIVAVRRGLEGECVVHNGYVTQLTGNSYDCQVVVRKKWQWPEWLKAEWIAMDEDGRWFAYEHEPDIGSANRGWSSTGTASCLTTGLLSFTPPPVDTWWHSKRHNPHIKENQCQK